MAKLDLIGPPKSVAVTFSLEPAYNVIGSLSLLDMVEDFSGLGEWVYQTAKVLSPEQLRTNQLVLMDTTALLADELWPSFSVWVDALAARDATELRDRTVQARLAEIGQAADGNLPDAAELLADRAAYLSLVEGFFQHDGKPYYPRSFWEEEHRWLNDPPAMQSMIVTHLRTMWDEFVAPEWERTLSMLEESAAAFASLGFDGLTAVEALSRVALRAQLPQECLGWMAEIEHLILIPSAHTGPYIVRLSSLSKTTARILFGARIPEGAAIRLPALSRSELLMRLTALADDTRLRILELLGHQGELSTPDIIAQLELSQSAASRHLEHLTATGYLTARRQQGANLYRLNLDRIDHTFETLKEFCQ